MGKNRCCHTFLMICRITESVCLTGASGRGKTTPSANPGRIGNRGRRQRYRIVRPQNCVCFSRDRLLPWITAQQNIRLARSRGKTTSGRAVSSGGLDSADGQKYPGQLSGGQRRRVAFLRGIAFLEGVKTAFCCWMSRLMGWMRRRPESFAECCDRLRRKRSSCWSAISWRRCRHWMFPFFHGSVVLKGEGGNPFALFAGTIFDRKRFSF